MKQNVVKQLTQLEQQASIQRDGNIVLVTSVLSPQPNDIQPYKSVFCGGWGSSIQPSGPANTHVLGSVRTISLMSNDQYYGCPVGNYFSAANDGFCFRTFIRFKRTFYVLLKKSAKIDKIYGARR